MQLVGLAGDGSGLPGIAGVRAGHSRHSSKTRGQPRASHPNPDVVEAVVDIQRSVVTDVDAGREDDAGGGGGP